MSFHVNGSATGMIAAATEAAGWAALVDAMQTWTAVQYVSCAFITLYAWDFLLMFSEEVIIQTLCASNNKLTFFHNKELNFNDQGTSLKLPKLLFFFQRRTDTSPSLPEYIGFAVSAGIANSCPHGLLRECNTGYEQAIAPACQKHLQYPEIRRTLAGTLVTTNNFNWKGLTLESVLGALALWHRLKRPKGSICVLFDDVVRIFEY
ncbi:hypothetical protein CONPUDRAFT_72276 [Coniophora puteana RWD-64-598 SS2]|uniref:Uncharacterized protein n=1 Tax=Coniophora puteana (strain RWD-64-598) TaxID=741705 RepID=A0A5M3MRX8_CONPW|nr:uncharacterized protein CONPUDRAFT_72276 [Coniophora puteana RWD-64-598 SS2]EIW81909.1 hypothetical protein CONPUDRAFT_72276 [Coniophora puteana RWD-64-598 SS2]